ncbi:MAG: hypothetical protein GTO45_23400 [Candidatus Aminicenantes bacterium]|nr:hypothetical protein [Candidatus Aminicenantes bacterium]NIN21075.1 hypothetical protein [Candidatus Aminicenantes bacterium]NIN44897.1 hypothetical protein [Candidatus Aminicenantes bacterium]NIN87711.1 hypothetical protein [Candidatus Aminicenantes bacterium]NIO83996.1 hypothetical protein [Candidatus Aminicenantes bacterium]
MIELKALLKQRFSEEIEKVILYGSRVIGDADEYSDYDILIVLKHDYDWQYKYLIQDVCWEIDYKYDVLTDVKIISLKELHSLRGKQPYIQNALENGVLI